MQFVGEHDENRIHATNEELGYLANVLCRLLVQFSQFDTCRRQEAVWQRAILAWRTGRSNGWPLEHRQGRQPTSAALPSDFLLRQDLVTVFRVGWAVLYEQVVVYVARA
jgi:hypothetical protein